MILLYPEAFRLLVLPLFWFLGVLLFYRRGRRTLDGLAGEWRHVQTKQVYMIKTVLQSLSIGLFALFCILALAGISWRKSPVNRETKGLDIVYAVDVSRSMLAQDAEPDRLERARDLLRFLLPAGDRRSLVIFKGEGQIMVPMTEDRVILEQAVSRLSPGIYSPLGTNTAAGLETALKAFPPGSAAEKAVVFVSDGESLSGNPLLFAREYRLKGVHLFSVAVGTPGGGVLPGPGGKALKDSQGRSVVSRVDTFAMAGIAEKAGGAYYDLGDSRSDGQILQALRALEEYSGREGRLEDRISYSIFVLGALVSLALHFFFVRFRWSPWF